MRQAWERAGAAGDLTGRDFRVLHAVFYLVSSWSRLVDLVTMDQIAAAAGIAPNKARDSVGRLAARGVVRREGGGGRSSDGVGYAALTGLWPHGVPAPPTGWVTSESYPPQNEGATHPAHGAPPEELRREEKIPTHNGRASSTADLDVDLGVVVGAAVARSRGGVS